MILSKPKLRRFFFAFSLLGMCLGGSPLRLNAQSLPFTAPLSSFPGMVQVEGGSFRPFFKSTPQEEIVKVQSFHLDRLPVTHQDFLNFVKKDPAWRRDKISKLFADASYLALWKTSLSLGEKIDPIQPLTQVSWFAANAYCEAQGKRLPTENEWEYAAAASQTEKEGRADPQFREAILKWYAKTSEAHLPRVGKGSPNFWGVYDLHGLVWEWVLDFNSTLVGTEKREGGGAEAARFCGSGGLNVTDKEDFPSFMRMSFRSSLKPNYTTKNLGFRCARQGE